MSADDTGTKPAGKRPNHVKATWLGEHRFESGRRGAPPARIDASGREGQSPVDTLLSALATCTAVDVVDILAKRRTPLASLEVDVTGERADAIPARLTRIHLTYRITGEGIEQIHADRAAELAVTKYCSVRDSLDPAMPVTWSVEILPTA